MTSFRIRPRFKEELAMTLADFESLLRKHLDGSEQFNALISDKYVTIKIPMKERHYWSPQLNLTMEETDSGISVRGLYGPKPSVWAIFFMSYAALGILALFVGVYGLSQFLLEKPAPILWLIPVFGLTAVILYFIAQAGQKVGAEQMFRIHHFYEGIMKDHVEID